MHSWNVKLKKKSWLDKFEFSDASCVAITKNRIWFKNIADHHPKTGIITSVWIFSYFNSDPESCGWWQSKTAAVGFISAAFRKQMHAANNVQLEYFFK